MIINVGDLITVLRFRDEATPVANQVFAALGAQASNASRAVSGNFTPAVQGATQAANQLTPAVTAATNAIGGGGGGTGGGGGGGGGLGGAADHSSYKLVLLGRGMREAGIIATAAFTVPILGAAAASIKLGGDFETITSRLVSLANVTAEDLPRVKQAILDMAPAVGVGPVALANALYSVSSTTTDTTEALNILRESAKLAAGGLGETQDVAKALTTVVNSYGKENIDAAKAADIMVASIRAGGAEAKDLAPVLSSVVPFAAKLGVSFQEVAANIAVITRLGVPTAEAVTQLNSVFAALTRETKRGEEALGTLINKVDGTKMSYAKLKEMLKDVGLRQTLQFLMDSFGLADGRLFDVVGRIEALKNILGATGEQAAEYDRILKEVTDSQGEAAQVFTIAGETFQFTWGQLVAAAQVAAVEISKDLIPILKDLLGIAKNYILPTIIEMIRVFQGLPEPVKLASIAFWLLIAAIGPFLTGAGMMLVSIGNLSRGFILLTNAAKASSLVSFLGMTAWPATAAFVALAAAIAAIWAAWKIGNSDIVKNAIAEWALSSHNAVAYLYRFIAGIERLTASEAAAAVAATNAAQAQADFNKQIALTPKDLPMMASHTNTARPQGRAGGYAPALPAIPTTYKAELAALEAEVRKLTAAQKEEIRYGLELGKNAQEIGDKISVSADVVSRYTNVLKDQTKANTAADKTQTKFLSSIKYFNSADNLGGFAKGIESAGLAQLNFYRGLEKNGNVLVHTAEYLRGASQETAAWVRQNGLLAGSLKSGNVTQEAAIIAAARHTKAIKDVKEGLTDIVGALRRLKSVSGEGSFAGIIGGIAEVLASIDLTIKGTDQMSKGFSQMSGESKDVVAGLLNIAQGAIAAGAAFMQATGSGTTFQRTMSGAATGAQIGGSILPGWGHAIGAVVGGLVGWVRGSKAAAEAAAKLKKEITDSTAKFKNMYPAIKDIEAAATAMGVAVNFDIDEEWELKLLNEQMKIFEERLTEVNDELSTLLDEANELGIGLPMSIQNSILQMSELGLLTEDTAKKFHALLWEGEVDWKKMKEAADRYGIAEGALGKGFQQSKINATAAQIINDFDLLTRGGTDVGTVLSGMAKQISQVVQDSIQFGTTIPENMKPWIEELARAGLLLDANGEAITDVSNLTFGAKLETDFEKLIRKLDEFLDGLREIPGLFDRAGDAANDFTDIPIRPVPGEDGGLYSPGTPTSSVSGLSFVPGSSGVSTRSSITVALNLDGRKVTDVVVDNLNGRLSVRGGR